MYSYLFIYPQHFPLHLLRMLSHGYIFLRSKMHTVIQAFLSIPELTE